LVDISRKIFANVFLSPSKINQNPFVFYYFKILAIEISKTTLFKISFQFSKEISKY